MNVANNDDNIVKSVLYAVAVSLLGTVAGANAGLSKWLLAGTYFLFYSGYFYDEQRGCTLKHRKWLEFLVWCLFFVAAALVHHPGISMPFFVVGLVLALFTFDKREHIDWCVENMVLICLFLAGLFIYWFMTWRCWMLPGVALLVSLVFFARKALKWKNIEEKGPQNGIS